MFTFTPLLGAQSTSTASQSLLEFDGGIKILIDIGWDETFDISLLQELESRVSSISVVLLTHPTLDHLGAFAHLCKHVPNFKNIPVYATAPVISLGRTLLQDIYGSNPRAATVIPTAALAEVAYATGGAAGSPSILLQAPTVSEIAGYFSLINSLKYSQPLQPVASPFSPSVDGLTITAYSAGHTLGGTIWHVQYGLESIVYAVDWNLAKENILTGAAWLAGAGGGAEILEPLRRPTALICSSKGIERAHIPGGRRKRDDRLLDAIDQTIAAGGTVLIPTDSSARILELAYILEQHWRRKLSSGGSDAYRHARPYLASKTVGSTLRFARSMVEWMDDGLVREMEAANEAQKGQRGGEDKTDQTPFDFRHVQLVERKTRMQRILAGGKPGVILASDTSLEWGFAAEALQSLCSNPANLVILTEQGTRGSKAQNGLSTSLWDAWSSRVRNATAAAAEIVQLDEVSFSSRQSITQSLNADETTIYQQYLARRRQMQSTQQGESLTSNANPAEAAADDQSSASSDSSDESDSEQQGRALNLQATINQNKRKIGLTDAELGINILIRKKNVYDYDVRGKRGREKMYPFANKRNRDDEYGDAIRPEDYLRAEERDEDAQVDVTQTDSTNAMGQKRKWDDSAAKAQDAKRQNRNNNKRQRTGDASGLTSSSRNGNGEEAIAPGSDASDEESDYEPEDSTPDGPRKLISTEIKLTLRLGICHVDFSALHEKRDLQMLIPLIKPRKLVITSGRQDETESLAQDCRVLLSEDDSKIVFTPMIGETVDASVDTNAWSVKLTRDLVKRLTWQTVKGLGVVAVTARLGSIPIAATQQNNEAEEQRRKKLRTLIGSPERELQASEQSMTETEPVLDVLPSTFAITTAQTTQPIHVGDLRLADLRRLMQASGHVAEFRGEGTLLVDGTVIVRKTAGGRIDVEGGAYMAGSGRYDPSSSFFDVRRKIYEGLAVVAGG